MFPTTWFLFRKTQRYVAVSILGVLFLLLPALPVMAQRRSMASISRMNAALRQQEITQLQNQLDEAKKALDSVTAQGTLTESQIETARQSALAARKAMQDTAQESKAINAKIRKIEEAILEAQASDSGYEKALDAIDVARQGLNDEMYRVLGLPAPPSEETESTRLSRLARLTAEQRSQLSQSPDYTEKKQALQAAMKELSRVKNELFQASDEWKKAHEEHHRIGQELDKDKRAIRGAASDGSEARSELRTAAQIAASARATIAQAQARLHNLGVKEKPATQNKPAPK